jgi:SAM-dependent methyltransferase
MTMTGTAILPAASRARGGLGSNGDYAWAEFDSEAYFQHYYGEPHTDDERVIRFAVAALREAQPLGEPIDVLDVGTGPNLIPFFCALPRARALTAWEYAESNVAWLKAEIAREDMRPQWRHFWSVAREAHGETCTPPQTPMEELRRKARVVRGSIFDLPQGMWDAATMFFCAESITARHDEFEAACRAYARSVRPGGTLAAAFLLRSAGYEVAGRPFPVLHLTPGNIEDVLSRYATDVETELIGITDTEIRSGYSGFVFAKARAR